MPRLLPRALTFESELRNNDRGAESDFQLDVETLVQHVFETVLQQRDVVPRAAPRTSNCEEAG